MRSVRRKPGQRCQFFFNHDNAQGNVPHELALEGVIEGGTPAQLLQLADVMQDGAGKEQVAVDLGIMLRGQVAEADQGNHVLEQTAHPGMVEGFCGGSLAEGGGHDGIVEKRAHQRLQPGIGKTVDGANQGRP